MLAATEQRLQTTRLRVTAACAGAAVALLALRQTNDPLHFALVAGFGALLAVLATWDAATMLLPNRLTYPGIVAALALCWAWPDHSWAASLLGGVAGGALMLTLYVVLPGFGLGDVKLCALIGLVVGWPHVLGALVLGVLANGLVAIVALLARRIELKSAIPYGPGLVLGALAVLLLGRS